MKKDHPAQEEALRVLFNKGYSLSKYLPDNAPDRDRIGDADRPYYLQNETEHIVVYADGDIRPYTPAYRP